jgi:hypothetical protein
MNHHMCISIFDLLKLKATKMTKINKPDIEDGIDAF